MSVFDLFWIFLIFSTMFPALQRRLLEEARTRLIRQIERRRGTRLITMIHRQETIGFFGLPISRYIDIEDSEQVLRAIRLTPPDMPIDLILHTPGGLVLAAEQIAQALVRHPAKVTVFIPHYAMSGGTLIALAADEIVMDENAVLGPVDPQLGQYPAASILRVVETKPLANIEDHTLILADIARKAMEQVRSTVIELLTANAMDAERAAMIAEALSSGRWTHDYPISVREAQALGLPVRVGLPEEIYQLMDMFPQATPRRPSVEYIPMPYRHEGPANRSG
ncbi:SDH family Clp fold serine proteinase [Thermoflexus sp.]|uniref:SDH family Clp fold serine proteinase n=1 Tax=Thermoflexus sp. TaxID=1969742 RepID=UPI0025D77283|nr:ATP-dependent Clp protease proteolytic subunit [Thermoflexus sp.]MDW8180823.1 ATP-dependent Clp protease proteolytic subunit [Anaerolineae bacterium]MCS6962890.1 ATP-dependent Clp protease proteolytic subunit [Thermoflexus sp.]MCS7351368.1 ATP-dependent Clp protease proteolytic subunit [Thermoflexus sp.]MCX7690121.1 ATP-dependent Clp protease proteolytic subunit [Thermoflexus sp.]MDW8183933.1 ATP-dependent Clp protease proteolytic subunit [Anaerolineae bacterium]